MYIKIICIIIITLNSCKSYTEKSNLHITSKLTNNDSLNIHMHKSSCEDFINLFPSDFKSFIASYGFDVDTGPKKLYSQYENDIHYFFECPLKYDSIRINKTINICINGRWEADAVGLFQIMTIKSIKQNKLRYTYYLNKLDEIKCLSFWNFIFDGSPPNDVGIVKIYDELDSIIKYDKRQSSYLFYSFNKMKNKQE